MRGFGSGLLEEGAARELVDTLDAVRQVLRAHKRKDRETERQRNVSDA